jgi:hypothetical protein
MWDIFFEEFPAESKDFSFEKKSVNEKLALYYRVYFKDYACGDSVEVERCVLSPDSDPGPSFFNQKFSHVKVYFSSVPYPWRFGTDPDPRICTSDLRIRILLFSSVTFNTPTKIFFQIFLLFIFEGTFTSFFKHKSKKKVTKK